MSEIVLLEKEGPLALITLNRPEKLNALDYSLIDRLMEVLDAIEDEDGIRALVLTGAGNRAFSSGADIACFAASVRRGQAVALREFVRRGQRLTEGSKHSQSRSSLQSTGSPMAEAAKSPKPRRLQSPATALNSAKPRSISDLRRLSAARSDFRG
jgi:hypothetical protein